MTRGKFRYSNIVGRRGRWWTRDADDIVIFVSCEKKKADRGGITRFGEKSRRKMSDFSSEHCRVVFSTSVQELATMHCISLRCQNSSLSPFSMKNTRKRDRNCEAIFLENYEKNFCSNICNTGQIKIKKSKIRLGEVISQNCWKKCKIVLLIRVDINEVIFTSNVGNTVSYWKIRSISRTTWFWIFWWKLPGKWSNGVRICAIIYGMSCSSGIGNTVVSSKVVWIFSKTYIFSENFSKKTRNGQRIRICT